MHLAYCVISFACVTTWASHMFTVLKRTGREVVTGPGRKGALGAAQMPLATLQRDDGHLGEVDVGDDGPGQVRRRLNAVVTRTGSVLLARTDS